ncbi:hypothetical protein MUU77_01295 [Pseudoxanthomonas sp. F37]|jgi:hypothetical protein|uniref:hypothetical protein n=1 Tax=Pseudoxanthomonas TaxID=83618 RepID=UPI001FD02DE9|nr:MULTISPECIES: hypothetical protein [Pseudoxanthomonas]UOV03984.1 hypothetical protein MUU75_12535 [Pseudoxanthomonas mexicana]UOV08983.1 hypothetical protein MUU77_01295 [Pseudoxanthomonas sp. F37]
MTRDSRAWRWIGFLIALVGVGFPYWQLAPEQAGLPRALYGPGLVAVGVIAMLLRAFGTGRFLSLWLLIGAAVPVAVLVRIAVDAARGVTGPGAPVADVVVALGLGLAASLLGMLVGSLFLLRSSRRPK